MTTRAVTPSHTSAFTTEDYRDIYPPGVERHYWVHARNRIIYRLIKRRATAQETILDVGCGTGIVTAYLRRRGLNCYGCDLGTGTPCDAETARHLTLGKDACDLEAPFRTGVSMAMLLDVLEHVESPRGMLGDLRAAFQSLRFIVFTVPARMDIWSNYDERNRHYLRYDGKTVHSLTIPGQFELVDWGYFFHALYLPARMMKLLSINRRTRFQAPRMPRLHALFAGALVAEQAMLPRRWPGSSIYGVLRCVRP